MKLFTELVKSIDTFKPEQPFILESQLEKSLGKHLEKDGFNVTHQYIKKEDRYDLICVKDKEKVCVEIKIKAKSSDLKQFDRYLPKFPNGFIIVCWQAVFSVKEICKNVNDQSPTPFTMIEIAQRYGFA